MNRCLSLLIGPALLMLACSAQAEPVCGDFLAQIGNKPAFIEFLECHAEPELQTKPLRATYRLAGRDAQAAERYLGEQFRMPPLRRSCCIWDAPPGFYRDPHSQLGYSVFMSSAETFVDRRESWAEIDYFYLTLDLDTEEP
ncbi:DUF4952 domain-containing protein [Pseudomonas chlororaphis]|uniref:DUF4952 domain-containing protein n=1 Tax=Pseudomonas chlororaphis TaxID=587753 RepID=UPI00055FB919|nr:DUF4952 domain-containing protein [Pseudomonas chlororaphis]WDG54276.1 DUF4952 domain-containing protein [Pseudomonas chlororaphis]WDH90523.1 DUF4952 domain-containing protein [Pseudomonas chlororaphis]